MMRLRIVRSIQRGYILFYLLQSSSTLHFLQLQKKSALIAERDLAVNMLRENSSSGSNSSSSQNYLSQDSKLNQDSRDSSSCNVFPQKIFSDSNRGARLTNECTDKFNLFEAILVSILYFFCFSYANILPRFLLTL